MKDTEKRYKIWDGIRDGYNMYEALEMLESPRRTTRRQLAELGEMVMMVAVMVLIFGW